MPDGSPLSVSGTLMGTRQVERITEIDGYEVDLRPSAHLLFLRYEDRPGVVGAVGALLGEASVNIASAQVSRGEAAGGEALMSLALDDAVPEQVLDRIAATIGAGLARAVEVRPLIRSPDPASAEAAPPSARVYGPILERGAPSASRPAGWATRRRTPADRRPVGSLPALPEGVALLLAGDRRPRGARRDPRSLLRHRRGARRPLGYPTGDEHACRRASCRRISSTATSPGTRPPASPTDTIVTAQPSS